MQLFPAVLNIKNTPLSPDLIRGCHEETLILNYLLQDCLGTKRRLSLLEDAICKYMHLKSKN